MAIFFSNFKNDFFQFFHFNFFGGIRKKFSARVAKFIKICKTYLLPLPKIVICCISPPGGMVHGKRALIISGWMTTGHYHENPNKNIGLFSQAHHTTTSFFPPQCWVVSTKFREKANWRSLTSTFYHKEPNMQWSKWALTCNEAYSKKSNRRGIKGDWPDVLGITW
jgi:hypothetical protein